jgi:hypothetical protein
MLSNGVHTVKLPRDYCSQYNFGNFALRRSTDSIQFGPTNTRQAELPAFLHSDDKRIGNALMAGLDAAIAPYLITRQYLMKCQHLSQEL